MDMRDFFKFVGLIVCLLSVSVAGAIVAIGLTGSSMPNCEKSSICSYVAALLGVKESPEPIILQGTNCLDKVGLVDLGRLISVILYPDTVSTDEIWKESQSAVLGSCVPLNKLTPVLCRGVKGGSSNLAECSRLQ
jgi:hypothetical protein